MMSQSTCHQRKHRPFRSLAKKLLATAVALTGFATPLLPISVATAQERPVSCQYSQNIVDFVSIALEFRPEEEDSFSRRYGAISAYLFERYGEISPANAARFFDRFAKMGLDYADDLALAYRIHFASILNEQELIKTALSSQSATQAMYSSIRAALLKQDGEVLFNLAEAGDVEFDLILASIFGTLVGDQSMGMRSDLALALERADLRAFAISILATMPTVDFLKDFVEFYENENWLERAMVRGTGNYSTGLYHALTQGYQSNYLKLFVPPELKINSVEFVEIFRGMRHFRLFPLLSTTLNQTGDVITMSNFATSLDIAVARGKIDPLQDPYAPWVAFYKFLLDQSPATIDKLSILSLWYLPDMSALDLIKQQIAASALEPFVLGQAAIPDRPQLLPDDVDWSEWVTGAQAVTGGDTNLLRQAFERSPEIVAELMFRANQLNDLPMMLPIIEETDSFIALAESFARRLDLRCNRYLDLPFATQLINIPLFRFGELSPAVPPELRDLIVN